MLRVAIMGAGLAGLACAHQLERYGFKPDIFEKRHRVGERFPNMEVILQLVHRPMVDPLAKLSRRWSLNLRPAAVLHTLDIITPEAGAHIEGTLGQTTIRGHDERSLECQLAASIHSEIRFNADLPWRQLAEEYDYLVVATGDPTISRDLGVWITDLEVFVKGGIVKGRFNPGTIKVWIDTRLAGRGYVYFTAFDEHNANLALAATPSGPEAVDRLWNRVVAVTGLEPVPDSIYKLEEFKLGRCSSREVGNVILAGNAGGFIDPFLGFGQVPSLISGLQAAEAIALGRSYTDLTAGQIRHYHRCLAIRQAVDTLTNEDFSRLVWLLDRTPVKGLAFSTQFPVLPFLAWLSPPAAWLKRRWPVNERTESPGRKRG